MAAHLSLASWHMLLPVSLPQNTRVLGAEQRQPLERASQMSSTVCAQAVPARQATRRAREPGRECRSQAGRAVAGQGAPEPGGESCSWAGSARTGQGEQETGREHQNQAESARTGQGAPEPGRKSRSWAGSARTGQPWAAQRSSRSGCPATATVPAIPVHADSVQGSTSKPCLEHI